MIYPVDASDLIYCANVSKYFTHDEDIINRGSILSPDEVEIGRASCSKGRMSTRIVRANVIQDEDDR